MRQLAFALTFTLAFAPMLSAQGPQRGPNGLPGWAYHIPDKEQPKETAVPGPVLIPGSAKAYTEAAICHGASLSGLGEVPRIAGLRPVYIFRQLFDLKNGSSAGKASELMRRVVTNLTDDDMIAISAYVGSLAP